MTSTLKRYPSGARLCDPDQVLKCMERSRLPKEVDRWMDGGLKKTSKEDIQSGLTFNCQSKHCFFGFCLVFVWIFWVCWIVGLLVCCCCCCCRPWPW